jgi:hypothetical protein
MYDGDLIFEASDPRKYKVSLSKAQYYNHVIDESGHTEFTTEELRKCISCPEVIYQSSTHDNRDVYFSKTCSTYPKLYLTAAVEIDNHLEHTAHVVTAHLTKHIKGGIVEGEIKYVKPKL